MIVHIPRGNGTGGSHVQQDAPLFKRATRWGGAALARLLFPPLCPACYRIVTKPGTICGRCWPTIRFFEPPWCEVLGTPFAFDMGEGAVSPEAIANAPPFRRLRSTALYDGVTGALVRHLKYSDGTYLAPWLAEWMIRAGRQLMDDADLVIPVPLHRSRLFARRFNQSAELARAIAALSGKPFRPEALIRRKRTAHQTGLDIQARADNVRGAFIVPEAEFIHVAGKTILLIDDVYTTGATVSVAAKALLKAGATHVDVLTFARAMGGDFQALGL